MGSRMSFGEDEYLFSFPGLYDKNHAEFYFI